MENSNDLINQSVREIQASSKTSLTEAGQVSQVEKEARQDAINQIFALFRINYHNQYHAAFGDTQVLNQAKRLWFESLQYFSSEQLLLAAKQIIEQSDFLPTLHKMLVACEENLQDIGLPPPREAYLEACNAPSPKAAYPWSHPAVYFAGLEAGWHTLSAEPEKRSFELFARIYRKLIRRVISGESLEINVPRQISQDSGKPLTRKVRQQKLNELKKLL